MRKNLFTSLTVVVLMSVFLAAAGAQDITTVAGGGPNNLPATSSSLGSPWSVVQDKSGNTYVSDNFSSRVFRIDSKGNLTVIAGNTVNNFSGDGGPATSASLSNPEGIALDGNGNVFIADTGNNVVRVVNTQTGPITVARVTIQPGNIATIVGSPTGAACSPSTALCGDGGVATSALLNAPGSISVDSTTGNIYVADAGDNRIREVSNGNINTVAGTGAACATLIAPSCGDGSAATLAQLNAPSGLFFASGNVYIADTGDNRIRKFAVGGNISTVAGSGTACSPSTSGCGDGGSGTAASFNAPNGVLVDGSGNIYIADTADNRVRVVNVTGSPIIVATVTINPGDVESVAGTGAACTTTPYSSCGDGKLATSSLLNTPTGLLLDGSADVFIADQNSDAIREVSHSTGDISTFAGIGLLPTFSGDGGTPTNAELQRPSGVTSDASGNIFIADSGNNSLRVVNTQTGKITVAGVSIAAGEIGTIVGDGAACHSATCGDGGAASAATLDSPTDIALDKAGDIFIADSLDSVIREVTVANGNIKTVAGVIASPPGYAGDGKAANLALLNGPLGLALDSSGNIYIADTNNNVIRAVNMQASGSITVAGVSIAPGDIATVAGVKATPCAAPTDVCGDGGPATKASFNGPDGVAVDASGDIFVADTGDNRVREIVAKTGDIQTFAGDGNSCSTSTCGDGGSSTKAQLTKPRRLLIDFAGDVFISDAFDFEVRKVTASNGNIQTVAGDGTFGFAGDGGAATKAEMTLPYGLGADPSGDLLLTDFLAWRVRRVAGIVPIVIPTSTSLTASAATVNAGASVTFTAKVAHTSGSTAPTGTVTFNNGTTKLGSGTLENTGSATFTTSSLAAGSYSVTAAYSGDTNYAPSTSSAVALGVQDFQIAANPTTVTVTAPGQSGTTTLTITPLGGFNQTLTYTCSGLPSGAACQSPSGATGGTLTITTAAASSKLEHPFGQSAGPFYALLLPGLLGLVVLPTENRKHALRSMRWLGLLVIVALATLWMPACGGGSSSGGGGGGGGNPGTPTGTSTVTVTATTGGNSALTHSVTITLTVQ